MKNAQRMRLIIAAATVWVLLCPRTLRAEPLPFYMHLTNHEATLYYERVWFTTGDTMWGPVRSNDFIALKGSPAFMDYIITSKDRFLYNNPQDIHFAKPPIFNAPPVYIPHTLSDLRNNASRRVDSDDGRLMTRLTLSGNEVDIQQYELGEPPDDLEQLASERIDNSIIFVDGQVEVSGVLEGNLTIGSAGDMWLIDDIRYAGSDSLNGYFDAAEMESMFGLASEGNIIIADTRANGRENGWDGGAEPEAIDHHSIIINAAVIALGESFTIQHQNDDWEMYQGPTPDERGLIHLTGSVTQWRHGYVHRSNHTGTGYSRDYHYDFRFRLNVPPGLQAENAMDIPGADYDRVIVTGGALAMGSTVRTLIMYPGSSLNLSGDPALVVRDSLIAMGTESEPVHFYNWYPYNGLSTSIEVRGGDLSCVDLSHLRSEYDVFGRISADSIRVAHSRLAGEYRFQGDIRMDSSFFATNVELTGWGDILLRRSLLLDGVIIRGQSPNCSIINNTVVGGWSAGIRLERFGVADIRNNIIAFNRWGIINEHWDAPLLEYNCVYGNTRGDYVDCEAGEGSISRDPLFEDARRGDYRLAWNSPARDAGDPDSPHDPDGTRADMGAYYTDVLAVDTDNEAKAEVEVEGLMVRPNPFNTRAVSSYKYKYQVG